MNDLSNDFIKSNDKREFLKNLVGVESQEGVVFTFKGLDKDQRTQLYSLTGDGVGFSKIDDADASIEVFSTENINSVNSEGSMDNNPCCCTIENIKSIIVIQTSVIRHMDHRIENLKTEIRVNSIIMFGLFAYCLLQI